MNKYIKYFVLSIYIALILFIFIEAAKSAEASTKSSNGVTEFVIEVVDVIHPDDVSITEKYGIENVRLFIRKAIGHFGLFLVLGLFGSLTYVMFIKDKLFKILSITSSGLIVAIFSELIQTISPERGPSIKDVGIDYLGYLIGITNIVLILFIVKLIKRKMLTE